MPHAAVHPTPQELTAFSLGKLPEPAATAVASHLDSCPACRDTVANLPPGSFTDKARVKRSGTLVAMGPVPGPAAAPPEVPPELVNHPKFHIVRELGRGGMGVIYLAQHRVMDKSVALKVISPSVLDNSEAVARFLAEARAAGKLDHPNIARAYDADQAGSLHFLVMEFVDGLSLSQLLERKGTLRIAHACYYTRQAALGLEHACAAGMVHRDIKPQNLMVTPKGIVKVLDFGLASMRGERLKGKGLTKADSFMGTPEYVAPEQATDARSADIRADIYSLGCTLYALLTGRPPFVEDTAIKLVLAHLEKEVRPLNEVRADVPAGLAAVVAKMLAKDPAQRYQRPNEVAQALLPFIKSNDKESGALPVLVPPVVSSPGTGTAVGGSTPRMTALGKKAAPGPGGKGAAVKTRTAAPPAPKRPRRWWQRPWVLAGTAAAVLVLASVACWLVLGLGRGNEVEPPPDGQPTDPPTLEVDLGGGVKMEFLRIDGGEFQMGAADGEKIAQPNEKPRHKVRIAQPFYLGKYPVTQEQYERLIGKNPSYFAATGPGKAAVDKMDTRQFPVERTTWENADAYCVKLTTECLKQVPEKWQQRGYAFRLPTEAQWEYACRAGTQTPFFFGDALNGKQANCDGTQPYGTAERGPSLVRTTKVGSYEANAWGLFDMHGNVWQWCQDCYDDKFYAKDGGEDPVNLVKNGDTHMTRGGCWANPGVQCRAAYRNASPVQQPNPQHLGFRVALRAPVPQEHVTLTGHTGRVGCVAFSPDGTRIVSGSLDKTARVWDARSGKEILVHQEAAQLVRGVAFSPDGKLIVSGGYKDATVKVWEAETDAEVVSLKGHTQDVHGVAFSPDSKHVASASRDGTVRVWDVQTGKAVSLMGDEQTRRPLPPRRDAQWVNWVAFSPDGKNIVSAGNDGTGKVWDAQTGLQLFTLNGHGGPINGVAYSPEGRRIASASADGTGKIWDAQTGQETLSLKGHTGGVYSVSWSPDGSRLASAGADKTVKLWDAQTGQELFTFLGHSAVVACVAFSPDGKQIVSSAEDMTIKVWTVPGGR